LRSLLYYEHKPFGETEGSLVEEMAYATWQVRAVREAIGKYDIDTDNPATINDGRTARRS
jgi:hypothetical protein